MSDKVITKTFIETGDFQACYAAERWCADNGISVGSMQGPAPRGLMYGDFLISKWRNLSKAHRDQLDGTMTGDMRPVPVTITIREAKCAASTK